MHRITIFAVAFVLAAPAFAQDDFTTQQTRLLEAARADLAAKPGDADALIWVGRRLGYLGRYEEAIKTYEMGERLHPADARFARHIGHRLISLRRFPEAEAAFERAVALTAATPDATEPDGLPNDAGVPTSTLKGNIWYHLGLARYLQGNFAGAARAYEGAAALAHNPDAAAAARYWLYLSLTRAGDEKAATAALAGVDADWSLIENGVYFELALCLRGERDCEALLEAARDADGVVYATPAYGVAMARLIGGDAEGARALLEEIAGRDVGAAFGRIAAEADLARGIARKAD
ncbi:MAG: hypothetical protein AAGJ87_14415 [Pseudomonadota bacterium]